MMAVVAFSIYAIGISFNLLIGVVANVIILIVAYFWQARLGGACDPWCPHRIVAAWAVGVRVWAPSRHFPGALLSACCGCVVFATPPPLRIRLSQKHVPERIALQYGGTADDDCEVEGEGVPDILPDEGFRTPVRAQSGVVQTALSCPRLRPPAHRVCPLSSPLARST
jgi:hypothetical protein